jgi:hypothetical protein
VTWAELHSVSEQRAADAELARRRGDDLAARALYAQAADAEKLAFESLSKDKAKTRGITAVSAVSLFYKALLFEPAEHLAHRCLADEPFPAFARYQLRNLLQVLWTTRAADAIGVSFVSGAVLVSVKGGQVVYGGAPLDLIVNKVSEIQAVFYRTVELLLEKPFRRRGPPPAEVQSLFTPWLFQVPAGSYQFAVRVQEPPQLEIFASDRPKVAEVASTFIDVMRAAVSDPEDGLAKAVPDSDYRQAFLRLARNLAPTGKRYEQLDIVDASSPASRTITFSKEARSDINLAIRKERPQVPRDTKGSIKELRGLLRGLHLDQDWLELTQESDGLHVRIVDAGEALDDVVGPMVNRKVIVTVEVIDHQRLRYRDIELDE